VIASLAKFLPDASALREFVTGQLHRDRLGRMDITNA
jgi:hypothetical protein